MRDVVDPKCFAWSSHVKRPGVGASARPNARADSLIPFGAHGSGSGPVAAHAWGRLTGIGLTFAVGLGLGLMGLLYVSRLWRRRPVPASLGPGAMAVAEVPA